MFFICELYVYRPTKYVYVQTYASRKTIVNNILQPCWMQKRIWHFGGIWCLWTVCWKWSQFFNIWNQNTLLKFEIGVPSCYTEDNEPKIIRAPVKALVVSLSIKGTCYVNWYVCRLILHIEYPWTLDIKWDTL